MALIEVNQNVEAVGLLRKKSKLLKRKKS